MHLLAKQDLHQQYVDASFRQILLLVSMGIRNMMRDTKFLVERIVLLILTTPICLHSDDFGAKFAFNKILKIDKNLEYIRSFL